MSEYSSLYFEVLKIKMSYGPRKLISGRKWHVLKQHGKIVGLIKELKNSIRSQ